MGADLEIVYRDPATLVAYEKNARVHGEDQVRQIRRSIDEFSFTNPILLREDEKSIGAGHGRQLASLLKPALTRVPTVVIKGLSDEQWRALIVADNKIAMNSGWDESLLRMELSDLKSVGFDLSLVGFSGLELTNLFAPQEGFADPDEEPDSPEVSVSQLGDKWLCGPHILVCGDSTNPAVVDQALAGALPMVCLSDPPYGARYKGARRGTEFLRDGTNRSKGDVANDDRADWREAWTLFRGDVLYVWHDGSNPASTQLAVEAAGFEVRSQIIWTKVQAVVGPPRGHYRYQHESAFYCVRKGGNGHWKGSRKENTLWEADRPKRNDTGHVSQKPVALWVKPIENHTEVGEHLLDMFAGSGVLMIACQMTGRVAHSIELDPNHVDRCVIRWEAFTGLTATLAETGETFAQVKERRVAAEDVV